MTPHPKEQSLALRSPQSEPPLMAGQPVALPSAAIDAASPIPTEHPSSSAGERPKIIFQPAVAGEDSKGRAVLRPNVVVTDIGTIKPALPSANLPSLKGARPAPVRLAQNVAPAPLPPQPEAPMPPPQQPVHIHNHSAPPTESMPMEMPFYDETVQGDEFAPDGYVPTAIATDDGLVSSDGCQGCGDPFCNDCGSCGDDCGPCCNDCGDHRFHGRCGPLGRAIDCLHGPPCYDGSLGAERVMHAPFFIDTTQPLKNCRVRFDFAWDEEFPDRAEYFWKKTGNGGPANSPSVDYQDIRFFIERGTDRFSVGTEIPIRVVSPDYQGSVAGLADMNVTTKAVLLDGRKWQLTQLFRSYFPTGSFKSGRGNGHTSLEPGFAYRYKWSDVTYVHGDLKYWFPLGGDPLHAGEVLNYGLGLSRVAIDRDCFAVIPTFEAVAWTVLDGDETPFGSTKPVSVDNMNIVNLCPGVRFVWENGNDCGTRELGISTGVAVSEHHWYESIFRVDLRWSF
jgi:hypothetical protein